MKGAQGIPVSPHPQPKYAWHVEGGAQDLPEERHGELLPPGGDSQRGLFFFFPWPAPPRALIQESPSVPDSPKSLPPPLPITQASSGYTHYNMTAM